MPKIYTNRLERAKQSISRLVDELENDKIGLIAFAGDAYTQIPGNDRLCIGQNALNNKPWIVPKTGNSNRVGTELSA
ncbi:MAG: hypothetical protein R2727_06870 [Bacteroidales bacterium]